jgi:serine/threonine protein kinase
MTVLTCASTGKSITLLGEEIANSGEAKVWRTNQKGYLAKIYHSPTPERVQKLAVMIAHPPTEPNSHLNHISFAWPKSVLKNDQGDFVGFLMPEIKDGKELINVYNPRRRQASKLEIDWRFLHTTALNIVSIIEALHAAGYVLGDIKQQNILVNNRALPSIIDTDSFQVKNPKNGKVYNCLVGSEGYTPPELIGKDFDSIEQTEVHDRFRLGVIIYQLLFGGNNPFQGKWTGAGETPDINDFIRWGLWVNTSTSLIEAVARTIPLEIVHPEIQQCFLKCFNDGHKNPNFRPTARKWLEALKVGNDRLTICGRVDNHYYSRTYGKCYWCDRSTNLGIDIFPGVVKANSSAVVESTSQTKIFAATNTLELVKQEGKIITVVGKVVITRHLSSTNIFFINFGNVSSLVNGYSPFTIVIFSEGLKNLSNSRSLTITQLSNWVGSYIKITGTLEIHQKSSCNTPQIILKDSNQISLISSTEANNLIAGNTNTNSSAAVKQTQSQVSQPAVSKPQNQPVIIPSTATTISSSVQPTQSKASQSNQSANTPRQVSQPPVYKPQNQPVKTQPSQTTSVVKNKPNKLLLWFSVIYLGVIFIGATVQYISSLNLIPDNDSSELTESELREIANRKIEKYITGIGISFKIDEKTKIPTIANIFDNSPAALGNLKVGDQIVEVNGISTSNMSARDVNKLMRGDANTIISLRIRRQGYIDTNTTLTRQILPNPKLDKQYMRRCSAWFNLKDYSEAIKDCNEVIQIDSNNDRAYLLRGASYYLSGSKYQGVEDLRKAASLGNEKAKKVLTKIK